MSMDPRIGAHKATPDTPPLLVDLNLMARPGRFALPMQNWAKRKSWPLPGFEKF